MVVLNQIIPFKSKPLWGTFNALAFVGYEKATPTGWFLMCRCLSVMKR